MSARTFAKFYSTVVVAPREGRFAVLLDSKPARTPGRAHLALPTRRLADAIAREWDVQTERVDPAAMPLTRLANTAIDRMASQRGAVIEHILGFGRNDLLCYRVEAPPELVTRQAQAWDPLLHWMVEAHAVRLQVGHGVVFVEQPADVDDRLQEIVSARDDHALVCLDLVASLTGSLVLALALADGHLAPSGVFAAAFLDEHFQAERWGRDEEAEARRSQIRCELETAERYLRLLQTNVESPEINDGVPTESL
ncbi:MAG TPA: ATP12 family protein [Rhizomicrobium sp.]|jgi:chaperone required for assembly of F1-ATPase